MKTLKLGNLTLNTPFFQASLSGYSDTAMRTIARRFNCQLTFAGVMLDKITLHKRVLRKPAFAVGDDEHPIGAQIMGTDPEMMASAATALHNIGYDLIDLNFACPAPKVLRRGRGGALLNDPQKIIEIYRRVRQAVPCPVLMKLRTAYKEVTSQESDNFWQICDLAAAEGIDALIVHGRATLQRYRGRANWDILAKLKQRHPNTTIIGTGDLFTPETIIQRLNETKIDGVAIARGAIGNPWIFTETLALLKGLPKPPPPTIAQQGQIILDHYNMVSKLYINKRGVSFFRKFIARYAKGHPERKKAQLDLIKAPDEQHLRQAIKHWYGVS